MHKNICINIYIYIFIYIVKYCKFHLFLDDTHFAQERTSQNTFIFPTCKYLLDNRTFTDFFIFGGVCSALRLTSVLCILFYF